MILNKIIKQEIKSFLKEDKLQLLRSYLYKFSMNEDQRSLKTLYQFYKRADELEKQYIKGQLPVVFAMLEYIEDLKNHSFFFDENEDGYTTLTLHLGDELEERMELQVIFYIGEDIKNGISFIASENVYLEDAGYFVWRQVGRSIVEFSPTDENAIEKIKKHQNETIQYVENNF